MSERSPPKWALWLLKKCASAYHREALLGDLIEQYQQGRGRLWCLREVAAAILVGGARALRAAPWARAGTVVAHLLAETSAVLAIVVTVAQARRADTASGMMSRTFISTLALMIAVAVIGFLVAARLRRAVRRHAATHVLLLLFGVVALGVGTITWAGTLLSPP